MGKLIWIEGTDCSGKETQSKLLKNKIEKDKKTCVYFSFPNYDSPTGKIVGGPYLGKEEISHSYFSEGAVNVNPKVASLYFAANRLYNLETLKKLLKDKVMWIIDILSLVMIAVILYTPLSSFLKLAPLSFVNFAISFALGFASVMWFDLVKLFNKIRTQHNNKRVK